MTKDHPLHGLMDIAMEKIKELVDSNTIIGEPITMADGTLILPVSKVSFGFASGGSDFPSKVQSEKEFFGGGTGAGISINPIAFLTISNGNVKLLQIDPYNSSADRIVGMVPDVVDKISGIVSKKSEEKKAKKAEKAAESPAE